MRGSRNFRQVGGGGVQVHLAYKKSFDNVFINLFHRSPVVTFKENYYSPRFQWVWNIFQGGGGGVQLFTGESNCFFLIETNITCDFPGGSGPPPPPSLWIRPCDSAHRGLIYLLVFSLFFFNLSFANSCVERGEIIASAAVLPEVVVVKY